MLMQSPKIVHRSSKAWSRLRVQLGGAFLFAVLLPSIALRLTLTDVPLISLDQNLAGMTAATILSVYLLRNIGLFPGVRAGYFVLPAVLIGYTIIFSAYLFLRIEYSRGLFLGSMTSCLAWLYFADMMSGRARLQRFAIVPFGQVGSLARIPDVEWSWLEKPVELKDRYDGLVADLRHDLPDEWEVFLANSALNGVPVFHVKQLRESLTGQVEIEHLSENSFGSLVPFMAYLRFRTIIDFAGALIVGLALLPLLLVVAAIIKLESPGPVLFRQRRIGYRGTSFIVTKFRTMAHNREAGDARADAITREKDERITRVGAFLRRSRIDELPQILNILRGEMSWIGPRPEAEPLSAWYESELPFYRYRHIVPPGITGWAQVNQGHVADLEQVNFKLQYDFYYIKNFSPWLDALIVAKTVQTMLTGFGSR